MWLRSHWRPAVGGVLGLAVLARLRARLRARRRPLGLARTADLVATTHPPERRMKAMPPPGW